MPERPADIAIRARLRGAAGVPVREVTVQHGAHTRYAQEVLL